MLLVKFSFILLQAYDGHMNLILSDVEETIMIVNEGEQATVSVGILSGKSFQITDNC